MTDKEKIREEVERLREKIMGIRTDFADGQKSVLTKLLAFIDTLQEEPVSEDLGEYINELSKQFQGVSFAKLSRIAVRVAKWQKDSLWKPADDDDLPEIDREVIALLNNGKVVFAHRPDPKGWDAKSIITEKVEHYTPETYDKGGWNQPNVKWWLDVDKLPNMEED